MKEGRGLTGKTCSRLRYVVSNGFGHVFSDKSAAGIFSSTDRFVELFYHYFCYLFIYLFIYGKKIRRRRIKELCGDDRKHSIA